jgi:hypothetical protein
LPRIAHMILTSQLRQLERDGIVSRVGGKRNSARYGVIVEPQVEHTSFGNVESATQPVARIAEDSPCLATRRDNVIRVCILGSA